MSTILVIDDEPDILENIIDLLEANAYQTLAASDPEQGIDLAQAHQPDLIICDVMMPGVNGHEVLRQIRKNTPLQTVPFMFLTAKSTSNDVRDGMSMGADDYLLKPFRASELLEAVDVRLKRRETFEQHRRWHLDELRHNMSAALPHELRTPLAAIQGYAEVLRSDWRQLPEAEGQAMLDEILSATDRLKRLSENYALYVELETQPDARQVSGKPAPVASASLLDDVAHRLAADHSREEDLDCAIEPTQLAVDQRHMCRLVAEIIDNAFKFSDMGSPVAVRGHEHPDGYHIRVVDRGWGMRTEQVKRLGAFVQFNRAHHEQQGVGLGLAVAHRIVQHSGGELDIASTKDAGTTVAVRLPYACSLTDEQTSA